MSTIGGLQTFNEPYILGGVTGGNDKQFYTLAMFLYEEAFRKFHLAMEQLSAYSYFSV